MKVLCPEVGKAATSCNKWNDFAEDISYEHNFKYLAIQNCLQTSRDLCMIVPREYVVDRAVRMIVHRESVWASWRVCRRKMEELKRRRFSFNHV